MSMLETIRTACLCIKLASSSPSPPRGEVIKYKKTSSPGHSVQMNGRSTEMIEMNGEDWKERKESCSDDEDEEDEVDEAGVVLSYKDLFRMATLGGATGDVQ